LQGHRSCRIAADDLRPIDNVPVETVVKKKANAAVKWQSQIPPGRSLVGPFSNVLSVRWPASHERALQLDVEGRSPVKQGIACADRVKVAFLKSTWKHLTQQREQGLGLERRVSLELFLDPRPIEAERIQPAFERNKSVSSPLSNAQL
jgi:hypothetical protein